MPTTTDRISLARGQLDAQARHCRFLEIGVLGLGEQRAGLLRSAELPQCDDPLPPKGVALRILVDGGRIGGSCALPVLSFDLGLPDA